MPPPDPSPFTTAQNQHDHHSPTAHNRSPNNNNDNDNDNEEDEDEENARSTSQTPLLGHATRGAHHVRRAWAGFIDFLFSDNVLEVALGLIIATQFTRVINSFVSDILLPPLSLIPGVGANFDQKFAVLRPGKGGGDTGGGGGYNTPQQARDDGAVILEWGNFIDKLLNFFIVGLALYLLAQGYSLATADNVVKRTVKCRFCRKRISERAVRCAFCSAWLDGRDG